MTLRPGGPSQRAVPNASPIGHVSVRKGEAGKPAAFTRSHFGRDGQPYEHGAEQPTRGSVLPPEMQRVHRR